MAELFQAQFSVNDAHLDRAALITAMREADVLVPTVTDRIDADMLAEALDGPQGGKLKLVANFGAGTEHLDVAAMRARKIIVTNTPGVFTDDTADLAMALIIAVPRRLAAGAAQILGGTWAGWGPSAMLGQRLGGKRLGIIGMGRIGQAVAHRARAFGLDVVYHNRHRLLPAQENMLGARYEADLDTLISGADILSLHCPAGAATRQILHKGRIAMMKAGACIINTARGDLIDEDAMIDALSDGRLGGAGLDVYPAEPAVNPRLLALSNVMLIPHLGSATEEGREAAGEKLIANIRFWMDGHRPPDMVLPDWV